jgi:hypothetical protein
MNADRLVWVNTGQECQRCQRRIRQGEKAERIAVKDRRFNKGWRLIVQHRDCVAAPARPRGRPQGMPDCVPHGYYACCPDPAGNSRCGQWIDGRGGVGEVWRGEWRPS